MLGLGCASEKGFLRLAIVAEGFHFASSGAIAISEKALPSKSPTASFPLDDFYHFFFPAIAPVLLFELAEKWIFGSIYKTAILINERFQNRWI